MRATNRLISVLGILSLLLHCTLAQGPYCVEIEEEQCEVSPKEECRTESRKDCETVEEETCVPATEEVCEKVQSTEKKCETIEKKDCKKVPHKACTPKTEIKCSDVPKVVCSNYTTTLGCTCGGIHDRRKLLKCFHGCKLKTSQEHCRKELQKECISVNSTQCVTEIKEECKSVTEEQCSPKEEISCSTKETQNCTTTPVEKCKDLEEEVCEKVKEENCKKTTEKKFCGDEEEDKLSSSILNGDVLGAAAVLRDSQNVFSLGAGLTYSPEENFLIVKSNNRSRDPDVVAFQAVAYALLDNTDVNKIVNAVILSFRPDCRCSRRSAAELDVIAQGFKEDFQDRQYLQELVDSDLTEFEDRRRTKVRKLAGTNASPVDSFICAYCQPKRSCKKTWWC